MTVVLSEWSQFAERHWIVGGILASLLWFFAGKQSLSKGRAAAAVFWQSVAVIIILLLCGWASRRSNGSVLHSQ
jgi:hypothetical protein